MKPYVVKMCVVNYLYYVKKYSIEEAQKIYEKDEETWLNVFELFGEEFVKKLLETINEYKED